MIGRIDTIYENRSKSTGKLYYAVTIDGRKHSYWEEDGKSFIAGDIVEYDAVQKGEFSNLRTLKKVDPGTKDSQPAEAQKPAVRRDEPAVSMLISYAKDLVTSGKTKEEAVDIVKFLVEQFRPTPER
jgi:hypothetical protein